MVTGGRTNGMGNVKLSNHSRNAIKSIVINYVLYKVLIVNKVHQLNYCSSVKVTLKIHINCTQKTTAFKVVF